LKHLNLAVMLSGSGTTLQNILDRIDDGTLDAEIRVVVSSRNDAYGLVRARACGIPTSVIRRKEYPSDEAFSDALNSCLELYDPDLVLLAGFMCYYIVPRQLARKVMNIHPALIPSFCGKGYYGARVHEAVIASGVKVSGCTVHFVDNVYDHGPIIIQRTVPVLDDDTPEALAKRVFEQECVAYPEAIRLFGEDRLRVAGRRVLTTGP